MIEIYNEDCFYTMERIAAIKQKVNIILTSPSSKHGITMVVTHLIRQLILPNYV